MEHTAGAYEAKTHLSALLDRVEKGERIAITRHGRVVALLVPPQGARRHTVGEVVRALKEFRCGRPLGPGLTVRDLVDEGRR